MLCQHGRQRIALLRPPALEVDQKAALRKGLENLRKSGHKADALAAQRKGLPAIGGIAIADIKPFQRAHRRVLRYTRGLCAAIERPVMEHGERIIRRQVHVQFDHGCTCIKGGPH